jgi:hypothetical protein
VTRKANCEMVGSRRSSLELRRPNKTTFAVRRGRPPLIVSRVLLQTGGDHTHSKETRASTELGVTSESRHRRRPIDLGVPTKG